MLRALLVLTAAGNAAAHICILEPRQRGNLSVVTPGDPSCYRRTNYCGGIPVPEAPLTTLVAGSVSVIKFQQNLNHWYTPNPGYLDISIAYTTTPTEADFHRIHYQSDYAGMEMVQSTMFNVALTIPDKPCAHCILRARYVSHNPMEIDPPDNIRSIFYNCADIAVVAPTDTIQEHVPVAGSSAHPTPAAMPSSRPRALDESVEEPSKLMQSNSDNVSCVTPKTWRASFLETNAWGWVEHSIWWDAQRNLTRWDKNGSIDASGPSYLSLINNYTAPLEYVNFVSPSNKCHIYGNDAIYPWAYGASSGMQHVGRTIAGEVDFWRGTVWDGLLPDNTYRWKTKGLGGGLCQPLGWERGEASVQLLDFEASPLFEQDTFVPKPECLKKPTFAGCRAKAAKAAWAKLHGELL